MKNLVITAATFTVLLAGQTAMAMLVGMVVKSS